MNLHFQKICESFYNLSMYNHHLRLLFFLQNNFFFFFFVQASLRTARNLKSCRNPESVKNDSLKSEIASDVVKGMGVVAEHPLGF